MSKSSNVNIPSNYDIQLGGDGSTIRSDTDLGFGGHAADCDGIDQPEHGDIDVHSKCGFED